MRHHWVEIKTSGEKEERVGECFYTYLHRGHEDKIEKIIFYIPATRLNLTSVINKKFYLRFLSEVLNKDVYVWRESDAGAEVEIDCAALNKNKYLIFTYLVFFRYFLEMPRAIKVFATRKIGKKSSPSELLISFLKQNLSDDVISTGCDFPNHCLISQYSFQSHGLILRKGKDIVRELRDPLVHYGSLMERFGSK